MAYADSAIDSAVSSTLTGTWLHDVADPETTARQYLFGSNAREESISAEAVVLPLVGRSLPLVEFGQNERQRIGLTFVVPFDEAHDDVVTGLRDLVNLRSTLCYRDGRGRLAFGVLTGISIVDEKSGTVVSTTLEVNNYREGDQ